MTLKGEITKFDFHPMVDLVPSVLYFWVFVPDLGHEVVFREEGSIPFLSAKFQFEIINANDWDFTGFEGRNCQIIKTEDGIKFLGLLPKEISN